MRRLYYDLPRPSNAVVLVFTALLQLIPLKTFATNSGLDNP